jgi:hypothetical protein
MPRVVHDRNEPAKNFEVAGEDGAFVPAKVEIKGASRGRRRRCPRPKQLRFMWDPVLRGNLYNECLPPARAFRIQANP